MPAPPIALPQLWPALKKSVKYPSTAPSIPPTDADVASAIILCREVFDARSPSYQCPEAENTDANLIFSRKG
jgi:hypothetical protein